MESEEYNLLRAKRELLLKVQDMLDETGEDEIIYLIEDRLAALSMEMDSVHKKLYENKVQLKWCPWCHWYHQVKNNICQNCKRNISYYESLTAIPKITSYS